MHLSVPRCIVSKAYPSFFSQLYHVPREMLEHETSVDKLFASEQKNCKCKNNVVAEKEQRKKERKKSACFLFVDEASKYFGYIWSFRLVESKFCFRIAFAIKASRSGSVVCLLKKDQSKCLLDRAYDNVEDSLRKEGKPSQTRSKADETLLQRLSADALKEQLYTFVRTFFKSKVRISVVFFGSFETMPS